MTDHPVSTPVAGASGPSLAGRRAVVTGGSSGLGLATARALAAAGARVLLTATTGERAAAAAAEVGHGALGLAVDVRSAADLAALAAKAEAAFGGLDIVFANAGTGTFGPLATVTEAEFDRQVAVNLKGVFFTVQALRPLLARGGAIVLNASAVHGKGLAGAALYSATKAAVRSLARSFAAEFAADGIRVNSVSPGYVRTAFQDKMGLPAEALAGFEGSIEAMTPLGRGGRAEEIAAAVLFLASGAAGYVTGTDLLVDGGFASA